MTMPAKQNLTICLWFEHQAEEAAAFYTSVFENAKITRVARYGEGGPGQKGAVMTAAFEIDDRPFLALNGRPPAFTFNDSISIQIFCDTQAEIDDLWSKLTADGQESMCGWLKDKFGVSWQIISSALGAMLRDKDPKKAKKVMQAMLQMDKIDIKRLKEAHDQQ